MKGGTIYLRELALTENLFICLYTETENNYSNSEGNNSIHIILEPPQTENVLLKSDLLLHKIEMVEVKDNPPKIIHRVCFSGADIIYLSEVIRSLKEMNFKIFLGIKVSLKEGNTNIPLICIVYVINIYSYLESNKSSEASLKFVYEKLSLKSEIKTLLENKYNFIIEYSNPAMKTIVLKQILIGLKSEIKHDFILNSRKHFDENNLKIFKLNLQTKKFEIFQANFNLIFTAEIILINCNLNLKGDYLITFCLTESLQFTYTLFTNFFNEGIFREENIGTFKFIDFVFTEPSILFNSQVCEKGNEMDCGSLLKFLINWKLKYFSNFKSYLVDFFKIYKQSGLVNNLSDNLLGCLILLFDFNNKIIKEFENGNFKLNVSILEFKYPSGNVLRKDNQSTFVSKKENSKAFDAKIEINNMPAFDFKPDSIMTTLPLITEFKAPNWVNIHFSKLNIIPKKLCLRNTFEISLKESKGLPRLPVLKNLTLSKSSKSTNLAQDKLPRYRKLIYGRIKDPSKTIFNREITYDISTIIDKKRIQNWILPISTTKVNELKNLTKFYEKRILVVSLCAKNLEKQNITVKNIIPKIIVYFNSGQLNTNCIQINELKCLRKMTPDSDEFFFLKSCEKFVNLINTFFSDNIMHQMNEDIISEGLNSLDPIENYIKISYILLPTLDYILFKEETVSYFEKLASCLFKYIVVYSFLLESENLRILIFLIEYICILIDEIQSESTNIEYKKSRSPFNITSLSNILEYSGKGNRRVLDLLVDCYNNFLKINSTNSVNFINTSIQNLENQIAELLGKQLKIFNEFEKELLNNKESLKIFQQKFSVFLKSKNVFKEPVNLHVKAFNDFISSFNKNFAEENEKKILKEILNTEKYKSFKDKTEKHIEKFKKLFEIVFYLQKRVCEYFGVENIEEIVSSIEYLIIEIEKEFIKKNL